MNRPQALATLRQLLPSIVSSGDPAGVLTKAADERGWSPEQLQHIGQLYNTAKSVTFMDKVAQEQRGSQHRILDVPKMVSEFARLPVKQAKGRPENHDWLEDAAPIEKAASASGIRDDDWFEDSDYEKSAGVNVLPNFMSEMREDPLEKSAAVAAALPSYRKSAATIHREYMDEVRIKEAKAHELQLLDDISWDQIDRLNASLKKFASSGLLEKSDEIEQDMQALIGSTKVARVVRALETYCAANRHQLKRASAPANGVVYDRHSARGLYEAIWDSASMLDAAQQMKTAAETATDEEKKTDEPERRTTDKAEGGVPATEETSQSKGKKPSEAKTKDPETSKSEGKAPSTASTTKVQPKPAPAAAPAEGGGSGVGQAMQNAEKGLAGVQGLMSAPGQAMREHNQSMGEVVDALKPSTNEHQRAVDQGAQEAQAQAALQRLLVQDDVISQAEPETVQRLYEALVTEEPALATNPEALAIALREAIQYNGVPQHTMSELSKHRKTRLEAEGLEREADRRVYAN